jgi:spermidine synthase
MLPETGPRRALILGMGGGTIANLLLRRFGPLSITGIEQDPRVIRLALSAFGLDRQDVEILEGDAFAFASTASGPYDYIAVDLFAAGAVPPRIFTRPFLKDVRRLLTRGGLAAFNYFKDRRTAQHAAAFEAVFPRVSIVESHKNLIARCRAR